MDGLTSQKISILVFSGFCIEEIHRIKYGQEILNSIDVLVAGRYEQDKRVAVGLRGSSNQTIHCLTDRYSLDQFMDIPPSEISIHPDGSVTVTGVDPLQLGLGLTRQ